MPGDLSNPEMLFPYHYDKRYEHKPRPLELMYPGPDLYIQDIAEEIINRPLSRNEMNRIKEYLDEKGYLYRNWGDQEFRDKITKILNKIKLARKVAEKCRI